MNSRTTKSFWDRYDALPQDVQKLANRAYEIFKSNPRHPSLRFKSLNIDELWSVRVGLHYRAIGTKIDDNTIVWQWIGPHERYNQLISK